MSEVFPVREKSGNFKVLLGPGNLGSVGQMLSKNKKLYIASIQIVISVHICV